MLFVPRDLSVGSKKEQRAITRRVNKRDTPKTYSTREADLCFVNK